MKQTIPQLTLQTNNILTQDTSMDENKNDKVDNYYNDKTINNEDVHPKLHERWIVVKLSEVGDGLREWQKVNSEIIYKEPGPITPGGPQYDTVYICRYIDSKRIGWIIDQYAHRNYANHKLRSCELYMQYMPYLSDSLEEIVPDNHLKEVNLKDGEVWELLSQHRTYRTWVSTASYEVTYKEFVKAERYCAMLPGELYTVLSMEGKWYWVSLLGSSKYFPIIYDA